MTAAIYCRLSREDEEKQSESESIQNQKSMLIKYALDKGWDIYNIYCDEDYSGIDRERPAFRQLIADAEARRFDIVLVKTQSRFTRDMELVEKYIHGLFAEWGIRFVATVDNVDTDIKGNKKARQINGLINEWYLEDLSGNVRAVLDHKRRSGCYIASFALYGYQKDPQDHNRLVIDPEAAAVVRRIFALYLQGNGVGKIARLLNEAAVPPPSAYRAGQQGCDLPQPMPLWSKPTVRRILSTQTYVGDMEQGRVRKVSYKSNKTVRLPRQTWIVVPDTHPAIVSRRDFAAVQERLGRSVREQHTAPPHLMAGLIRCGICGGKMELTGTAARRYYRCRTAQKSRTACPGQPYLPMQDLEGIVRERGAAWAGTVPTDAALRALLERAVICPPLDGKRKIELHWRF